MIFDDPAKQHLYDEAIAACSNFTPPLTEEEKLHIFNAVAGGGTIMLRCWWENGREGIKLCRSYGDSRER